MKVGIGLPGAIPGIRLPIIAAVAVVVTLVLAGCSGGSADPSPPSGSPTPDSTGQSGALVDITDVEDLRVRFSKDAGSVRLVLLLSPT